MAMASGSRSLTAKLSYLMTFVVMVTVSALTWQSANKFSAYILQTIEENSTSSAETAAADISSTIEKWLGQITVTASKLSGAKVDANNNDTDLAAALRNDKDLLVIHLYSVDSGNLKLIRQARQDTLTFGANATIAEKKTIETSIESIGHFAADAAKKPNFFDGGLALQNITPKTHKPSLLMAIKFLIPNQPSKFGIMIVAASSTKLQIAMPQSRFTSGYVITKDGSIFASTDETQMSNSKPISGNELVKKALKRQSPAGFLPEFLDRSGKLKLGSYAQARGKIPLYVIVERDRKAAFRIITRTYTSSALWGALILLLAAMVSYLSAGTVTKNLRDLVGATKKISDGDFGFRLQPHSRDEVAELGHSVNNMASRIQMLMRNEVEKARLENELETAKIVQSTFFPKKDISRSHLSVTGNYQPATECGGDLWGHYTVKDGVELVFIADAMGHGAPSALVTAIAYAVCQSVANILGENSNVDPSPASLLRRLNSIIMDAVDGKISMTFFVALFDFNEGQLTMANAGHNFPFILTGDKDDLRLSKQAKKSAKNAQTLPITLTLQGTPLGVERGIDFKEKSIDIKAGDKIFFFTDGLIENYANGKPPLGRKALIDSACMIGHLDTNQIKMKTLEMAKNTFGTQNLQDDVTIVVAEVSKSWVKTPRQEPSAIRKENETQNASVATIDLAPIPIFELVEASDPQPEVEASTSVTLDLGDNIDPGKGEVPASETPITKIPLPAV